MDAGHQEDKNKYIGTWREKLKTSISAVTITYRTLHYTREFKGAVWNEKVGSDVYLQVIYCPYWVMNGVYKAIYSDGSCLCISLSLMGFQK